MKKVKLISIVTLVIGIISFLWLMAQFLCIGDIGKGTEPDLTNEWFIVSYSYIPLIIFHIAAFITIAFYLLSLKQKGNT